MGSLPPILPAGTAVVALVEVRGPDGRPTHPRGTAGVIVRSPADPEHSYRVRFPGGDEVSLKRRELQVLKHYQREGYDRRVDPLTEYDLYRHVIYRSVVGSRAFGLEEFRLPYIPDLIARKLAGGEHSTLDGADLELHVREKERLEAELKRAGEETTLPGAPTTRRELSDLLVRLRGLPTR